MQELALEDADMWFIRFSMDAGCRLLACGSRTGRVFMWDMDTVSPHCKWRVKRPLGKDNTVSLQVAQLACMMTVVTCSCS